jgi:hypothetical protein
MPTLLNPVWTTKKGNWGRLDFENQYFYEASTQSTYIKEFNNGPINKISLDGSTSAKYLSLNDPQKTYESFLLIGSKEILAIDENFWSVDNFAVKLSILSEGNTTPVQKLLLPMGLNLNYNGGLATSDGYVYLGFLKMSPGISPGYTTPGLLGKILKGLSGYFIVRYNPVDNSITTDIIKDSANSIQTENIEIETNGKQIFLSSHDSGYEFTYIKRDNIWTKIEHPRLEGAIAARDVTSEGIAYASTLGGLISKYNNKGERIASLQLDANILSVLKSRYNNVRVWDLCVSKNGSIYVSVECKFDVGLLNFTDVNRLLLQLTPDLGLQGYYIENMLDKNNSAGLLGGIYPYIMPFGEGILTDSPYAAYFNGTTTNSLPSTSNNPQTQIRYAVITTTASDIIKDFTGSSAASALPKDLVSANLLSIKASSWEDTIKVNRLQKLSDSGGKVEAKQIDYAAGEVAGSIISGGKGNDDIKGFAGWDILDGGEGDDLIHGGNGRDIITGGAGRDELHGDFGWNTYKSEIDGASDLIAIKSDQYLVNWLYGKAGNSANGEKADIIEGLDAIDKIKIIGVDTKDLTFAANIICHGVTGIGIYGKGVIEALYTGGNLNVAQIKSMTTGDASAAAMSNSINAYGIW